MNIRKNHFTYPKSWCEASCAKNNEELLIIECWAYNTCGWPFVYFETMAVCRKKYDIKSFLKPHIFFRESERYD